MHEFASLEDTEASLRVLIERTPEALVARLPRQAGTKELRYAHLMGGEAPLAAQAAPAGPEIPYLNPREERIARLEAEISGMRSEIDGLKTELADLKAQLT
ncbi:MAG TPA: hypothetical protein VIJ19_00315, partial [Opitutaceae bacterium]